MLERLSKSHRNIALGVIAVVLAWFAWTVRSVLNPLILGYLLAYILRPLVQRLEDRGMARRSAVNIIFGLFGLALLVIGGGIVVQGRQFVENQMRLMATGDDPFTRIERSIDALLGDAGGWFQETFRSGAADALMEERAAEGAAEENTTPEGDADGAPATEGDAPVAAAPVGGADGSETPADGALADVERPAEAPEQTVTLRNLLRAWTSDLTLDEETAATGMTQATIVLGYVQRIFGSVLSVLGFLVLLPVYTYFLLFELERIHDFLRAHVPKTERERVTRIGQSVGSVIANFFRGRLLICLLKGLVLAVGLTVLQVPYGLLIGMIAGFMSLIPFVGPFIGYVLAVLVVAQSGANGLGLQLALVSGVFMLAEVLEGYVFIPKVLGDSLGLHPVVILLSVFVGGAALGLFGFLIAIPLAATVIILFRELVMPAIEDFAEEDSHTDGPRPHSESAAGPPAGGVDAT